MNFFEKILSIDYTGAGLSSIEQLLFLKIAYNTAYSIDVSAKSLCASCGCSKPTLHLSISKLELLNFIVVSRSPGSSNKYFVNNDFVDSLLSDFAKAKIELGLLVAELELPKDLPEPLKLTKGQRKRLNSKSKRRW